ncbi:hypothetical protein, partial [Nocardia wallacei]|uniref:hypothetical protein n=1 Tax=Nocardia wallacei TaxID=480035 RepID=UPI002454A9D8
DRRFVAKRPTQYCELPSLAAETGPRRARSAEQARDVMSAIENGTRQGRQASPPAAPEEQEGEGDLFQHR